MNHFLLLTQSEQYQLLEEWTNTQTDYPRNSTIHHLFQLQAAQTPNSIAIAYKNQEITYHELDKKSNKLANYLQKIGVTTEILVALYLDRSPDLIITILAILKAGGTYLPLDTSAPKNRIKTILGDSQTPILITQKSELSKLQEMDQDIEIICLDDNLDLTNIPNDIEPDNKVTANNLAYVMYTSGSTGKPKGVCVLHRGVIRLVKNTNYAHFGSDEVVLQLASIAFDAATFEIWAPLLNGGKLVLMPSKTPSLQEIGAVIKQYNVTTLWLTAGLFNLIVEEQIQILKPLRQLLAGGDVLSIINVKKVLEELPNCQLINGYGPTENTTFTCCHKITIDDTKKDSIPIGHPIANTQVYILDNDLQLVPIGITGELYIGGDGLARGYLNQTHLTTEKFIKNPFSNDPNSRLYKTGDRVRWNTEGNIEFLGRIDFQVKIRGYRVELGEIESVLQSYPGISDVVVVARENPPGNKQLVGYIVPKKVNYDLEIKRIKDYLANKLPDYMIPSLFLVLDKFPLNINGKVDRSALPIPEYYIESELIKPRNAIENRLAVIWQNILGFEVGINQSFTSLGGHSLQATQIISRIRDAFGVDIPLIVMLQDSEQSQISSLAVIITNKLQSQNEDKIRILQSIPHENEIPLTVYQERIWLLAQIAEKDPIYNLPMVFRLQGNLKINLLEEAINEVIKRHESLRTIIPVIKGLPRQRILPELKIKIDLEDVTITDVSSIENLINLESSKYFNLEQDALIRVKLLNLDLDDYILIITCHHIISDGWSLGVLLKEIRAHYIALQQKCPVKLPELHLNYGDFSLWYEQEKEQRETVTLEYWKKQLEGTSPLLNLPTDYPRPPVQTFKGSIQYFAINQDLKNKLETLGQKNSATLFMVLLATFQILLHRYANQEDIVIGTPIANRNYTAWENLIGCFINVVPLRSNIENNPSFQEFLAQIKKNSLEAYTYPDFPLEKLLSQQQSQKDLSYLPLFQVLFVLLNVPDNVLKLPELTITEQTYDKGATIFDLTFLVEQKPQGLKCSVEYNTALYTDETITRLIGHFQVLLESIITNPEQQVKQLPLLNQGEEKQLLQQWNQTRVEYPKNLCLPQLFEAQVQQTPNNIAVIFEQEKITYQELNQRANQLASYLRELGVKPDTLVGIYLDSSPEMIIAILGILKAGGAYLPLDPTYPQQRINYMLENAKLSVLISVGSLIKNLREYQGKIIFVDENSADNLKKYQQNPTPNIKLNNLAYVIYTSGSTGTPKGVQIEHQSLTNLLFAFKNKLKISAKDIWLAITTLCFDIAALEIFLPLITGAKLLLVSRQVARDGRQLLKILNQFSANILQATPTTWQMLLLAGWQGSPQLTMLTGGEALSQGLAKQLLSKGHRLYNVYGPTETTIWSLFDCITNDTEKITIGRPIANTQVYILDEQLQLVPIGIPGELYISGDGLARGYLNHPDLTQEKFIANPFGDGKLYKTGDLVRYLADGKIEFLGRIDNQVKIRGFRIELGEIESVLNEHPQIDSGLVIVRENPSGNKDLVAYIITELEIFNPDKIRSFIKQKLPEYMIPNVFVRLEKFPLTPNGKINRRALPASEYNLEQDIVKPRNVRETCLTEIWQDILGFEVGINQSFTSLGGHSLQATQIISRIRDTFGVDIPLIVMLQDSEQSQISSLAVIITNKLQSQNEDKIRILQSIPHENEIPLTIYQERIWLLGQIAEKDPIYNLPMVFRLQGNLKINLLEEAINEVIKRHESLRTIIPVIKGLPRQRILPELKIKIDLEDVTITGVSSIDNLINLESSKYFNLEQDALIRVKLLNLDLDDYILIITCHHIISDGWSLGVLLKEIRAHYIALQQKCPVKLSELHFNYGDFSLWYEQEKEQRETVALEYWKKQLEGASPLLNLPTDYPRPSLQTFKGSIQYFAINQDLKNKLETLGQKNSATLFMVLLATFQILLHRYANQEDIVIGTPIANRNYTAWESLIGCFVNVVPLRSNIENNPSFQKFLAQIQKNSLEAYTYPDFPLEKLLSQQQYQRDLSYSPLFQVIFVLLNVPDNGLELPGLKITEQNYNTGATIFDLTFLVEQKPQGLKCSVEYNTALYTDETITRLIGHFQVLLQSIITNPEQQVKQLPLLNQGQEKQLLEEWNQTKTDYPKNQGFLNLFELTTKKLINNFFDKQKKPYKTGDFGNDRKNENIHFWSKVDTPQTELELRLINIWEQALNINSISLQDKFFDLGGHSLLAMRILAKIEQEFNINLPLSNFLQKPTIASIIELIKYQNNIKQESSVFTVQNQGENTPIFFVNSISQAQKMGSLFDKNQPFYILNIFGITEFLKPYINSLKIEDIAAKLIEDMQTIQPHGPYFLITYCADSFLTFEMAQQLQAKGEKIALLAFIDSIWEPEDLGVYLFWYNLRQFGLDYLVERFKNRFFWTKERCIIRFKQWQGQLFSKQNKPLSRYLEDVRLLKAFELARDQYSPQSYSGKVTLFVSQEYRLLHSSQLESLVTEGVEIQEIPGYHHTLFKDPYIQILVQKIQTYLNRI